MNELKEQPRTGQLTVKLESGEHRRLQSIARTKQRTPHYIMREAITKYLDEEEIQQRFLDAAMQSREHYKETGLHITHEEFSNWVDALKNNIKEKPPACHK